MAEKDYKKAASKTKTAIANWIINRYTHTSTIEHLQYLESVVVAILVFKVHGQPY